MRASAIRHLAGAGRSPRFAAGFFEHTVQIWDSSGGAKITEFETVLDFGGKRLALNDRGDRCVTANWSMGRKGGVACYHALTGATIWHRTDIRRTQHVRFLPGDSLVSCGLENGPLLQLDARTGETVTELRGVRDLWISDRYRFTLLDRRKRGYQLQGSGVFPIAPVTGALLDVCFGADSVCLSESAGPLRCYDCNSGVEKWRVDSGPGAHVLHLCFDRGLHRNHASFHGLAWGGGSKPCTLLRFDQRTGKSAVIGRYQSTEACFCAGESLITSGGEVVRLEDGTVAHRLPFPITIVGGPQFLKPALS